MTIAIYKLTYNNYHICITFYAYIEKQLIRPIFNVCIRNDTLLMTHKQLVPILRSR